MWSTSSTVMQHALPHRSLTDTRVESVQAAGGGYRVVTQRGTWQARAVIIATGACNTPNVPRLSADMPAFVRQLTPFDYRSPSDVAAGGVLVVGASATGLQLADELLDAGHAVTIATGEHVRLPRQYRGRDILHWMETAGVLDETYTEIDDLNRARNLPSMQLVGAPDKELLDLNAMQAKGGRICGRLAGVRGTTLQFSGSLKNVCALADLKMNRLLAAIDAWIDAQRIDCEPARRFAPTTFSCRARTRARCRSARRSQRHLGDGIPAGLQLARRAGARPQGPAAPRRRCRRPPRAVCTRLTDDAAAQFEFHCRQHGRRARHRRAPGRVVAARRRVPTSVARRLRRRPRPENAARTGRKPQRNS